MKNRQILVVGAGLYGATVARQLAEAGFSITIIDKKPHVGGHVFDYTHDTGIRIHKYGPHIFHTSNRRVIDWVSRFGEWVDYEHRVVAKLKTGRLVPFPPNADTLNFVPKNKIIDTFYRPYSEKMWDMKLEEVNSQILNRVPTRTDREDRYFPKCLFQKIPLHGYTHMVENILDHPLIRVHLEVNFTVDEHYGNFHHIFSSQPIDEFFKFKYGRLPYRSIKFHHNILNKNYQTKHTVINYTDNSPFTRQTEWKNFPNHGANEHITIVTIEEPCDYMQNNFERYYPVIDIDGCNRSLYHKYALETPTNMTFIGRCGLYVYIDMDQAISSALSLTDRFIKSQNH